MTELLAQAIGHHRAGRFKEAESHYRKILTGKPRHADALHLLGLLAHQTGHPEDAAKLIRSAVSAEATRAPDHYHFGVVLAGLGDPEGTERACCTAIRLQQEYSDALNNLGDLLIARERFGEAAELFRRAIEQSPDDARYRADLGSVLPRLEQPRKALDALEAALARDPNNLAALYDRGQAHRACNTLGAVVRNFRQY